MKTDLKIALRTLLKARGFTALAVVMLALGIALNASIFAVVNAYLLRPLPFPGSSRLYNVLYSQPGQNHPRGMEALPWNTLADLIEQAIAWDLDMFFLVGGDHPESTPGAWVTPGFMQGLGIRPAIGRAFSAAEFHAGSSQVALISHSLWQNRFGGDRSIVGRRFQAYVSDRPDEAEVFTIIGIMPAGFWHMNPYTEIFAPLRAPSYPYMARLKEGIPPAEAERRITELVRSGVASLPSDWRVQLRSTHREYVVRLRPMLVAVASGGAIVLLIACANVAFLLLIRASRRKKEIALRLAIGASRWQMVRMLFAEALLLGTAATSAGLVFTWLALSWLAPIVQRQLGRTAPGGATAIAIDGVVLAAVVACCLLTAILFALAPLAAVWRTELSRAMQSGSRSGTDGKGSRRARSLLVGLEVAGSLALLAGCGLMVRTVVHMMQVDFGYQNERVLLASLGIRQHSYPDEAARLAFYERLLPQLSSVPGVQAAAVANWPALQPSRPAPVEAQGDSGVVNLRAGAFAVSPDFFAVLGVSVVEGRTFGATDRIGAEPVAALSETLARRLWPQTSAVGKRIRVSDRDLTFGGNETPRWRTIVGVVRDVRQSYTDEDLADLYAPLLQLPGRFASLYVKTSGPTAVWFAALRRELKEIDPEVSLNSPRDLETLIADHFSRPQFLASLLAGFSLFAALLALVGVYGIISYGVKQREHEIAVRMAVGADARAVIKLFVRQGATVLAAGIAAGLAGAIAIGKVLEAQLYRVRPVDPVTLVAACVAFAVAGLIAVWWPARRAALTDPSVALREQ